MSFIADFFGRLLFPNSEETPSPKKLNPLYQPKLKKDDFDKCERIMDEYMTSQGYRKLRMGKDIPRPKRRSRTKMQIGDRQVVSRVRSIEGRKK